MESKLSLMERTAQQTLEAGMTWTEGVRELRKARIAISLRNHKGNVCHAAAELRLHRNTLSRQIEALGLDLLQRKIRAEIKAQRQLKFAAQRPAMQRPDALSHINKAA
jgi:DNA-binding NtrC family response regulator